MANKYPVEIDNATGEVESIGGDSKIGSRYRAKLDTLRDVKNEMSRVYTDTRRGKVDVADCTKLIYSLNIIGKTIIDADLEHRLVTLENSNAIKNQT